MNTCGGGGEEELGGMSPGKATPQASDHDPIIGGWCLTSSHCATYLAGV